MKTISLPDELNADASLSIHIYESAEELSKQQVELNKNTFSFLQEGTKDVYFDNAAYSINSSQFLLMKSGNCLMTEKLSSDQQAYRSFLFFFSNQVVLDFLRKYELRPTKTNESYSTYFFDYDDFIKRFTDSLLDVSKLSKTTQKLLLQPKFEEIMLYLIEFNGVNFLYSLIRNSDDENRKFVQTIERNRLTKLTIKELAFISNRSVSSFKRKFEENFNTSPSKWFQDKRLEHAAFILKSKAKRPSDIYEEIGCENLSSFIQAFKVKYGVTPKQYA